MDTLRAADLQQNQVCCCIVAERHRQTQQLAQGNVYLSLGIFVLQRTVRLRDAIGDAEADGLIEFQFPLLNPMQRGEGKRRLEYRLHWRMRVGVEVATDERTRQGTRDRHLAVS